MIKKEQVAIFSGRPVDQYTLINKAGMEVAVLNYGGIIRKIVFPDRSGRQENRVLAYKNIRLYEQNPLFLGAVIGRVAGRIRNGRFSLPNGIKYELEKNDGANHLHGGSNGFHHCFWQVKATEDERGARLTLALADHSRAGYPGNLQVTVIYTLDHGNRWTVSFRAETDAPTICNMTQHTYFNLAGSAAQQDILRHQLRIDADWAAAVDEKTLPTGQKLWGNQDRVFDFSQRREIGRYGMAAHPQQQIVRGGYDHAFALRGGDGEKIALMDPVSGINIAVSTTEEAVVIYTGNKVDASYELECGMLRPHMGVTMETQAQPDAIHSACPDSVMITPERPYESTTCYAFKLEK